MGKKQKHGVSEKPNAVLAALLDELGITTPKGAKRPPRKGPLRVRVLNGKREYYRD
jgi:hypothetical protein